LAAKRGYKGIIWIGKTYETYWLWKNRPYSDFGVQSRDWSLGKLSNILWGLKCD